MIVLSLFDGVSCGKVALERAGITVNKYYTSEIDKNAEKISIDNHKDMVRLGNIENWREWDIEQPDMIIGGSPCQGFSTAGMGLNFNDPRSKLFFVYADILRHYHPKYFLLENVTMAKEYEDTISRTIGEIYPERITQSEFFDSGKLEPIKINSALVSAQNRERLYWCNWDVKQPKDKGILLKDIVQDNVTEQGITDKLAKYIIGKKGEPKHTLCRKSKCFTAGGNSGGSHSDMDLIPFGNSWRKLTVIEVCRLQTLPDDYCKSVSKSKAYFALGNGWTVDVIAHIFKGINT